MNKLRLLIFLSTILIVGGVGIVAALFARGWRLDRETFEFGPHGLLVANSEPTGAQIFINGELKSATDATISLSPGTYDLSLKKEGFSPWHKRVVIEKEIVTQVDVSLFSSAPSLSAITFAGSINPAISPDFSKIIYGVPPTIDSEDKGGLWVLETLNLPLGFNREARRITDGDMTGASWMWSPDSRQILLTTLQGTFLLNLSEYTPQDKRINILSQKQAILATWEKEKEALLASQLSNLPVQFQDILKSKARDVVFSPNEKKILYTSTDEATWQEGLVPPLPGSSTQKQERGITPGRKYVYDIKEDRNFYLAEEDQPLYWFPTSHHLVAPEKDKISIMDYDGTNRQTVYSGSYIFPHAYATTSNNRLLILTNFGASENLTNLYSLGVK